MAADFLGAVKLFGGDFAIKNYALCQGQQLSIQQNAALFALLGTQFGGNGQTTFALPDLRGRVPVGQGQGQGLSSYNVGQTGGVESVTLTQATVPSHRHSFAASTATGTTNQASGNVLAALSPSSDVFYAPVGPSPGLLPADAVNTVGNSQAHTNIQPTICITYLIALSGIFPSRN
jgi:microcystin-dependent protein